MLLKAATASCINDTNKRQLVTISGLSRLRCCVCHLHHKWAMNSHAAVREFFGTVLQQMYHFKVDVIAGDANAAAYKYYKKQEYQNLHNASVAIMLREMQSEVNMGLPFENKLRIDYSTNNRPTQLHAANDIDCYFMAILSWGKPVWSNLLPGLSMISREQIAELLEQTADKKEKNTEDISRERGVEIQLRMAAKRGGRHRCNGSTSRL